MKRIVFSAIILGLFVSAVASQIHTIKYDALFEKYGNLYQINPDFVKKIAIIESGLNESKVTLSPDKKDSFVGLFQLSEKYFNVNSKNIDNEDIVNKAVKLMRDCLDRKGYTVDTISCINKTYTDADKKILLSLLMK